MRRKTKGGAVLEAILILAGLALIAKAGMAGAATFKLKGLAEQADGVVNAVSDHGFTLSVIFTAGTEGVTAFSQTGLLFGREVGTHVPVLFDPSNPNNAMIGSWRALWFKPFMLALPGFLLLALGFRLRGGRNL